MRPTSICLIASISCLLLVSLSSNAHAQQYQYQNSTNNRASSTAQAYDGRSFQQGQNYQSNSNGRRAISAQEYIESTSPLRGGRGQVTSRSVPGSKVQTVTMIASLPVSDQLRNSPAQPRDDRYARAEIDRNNTRSTTSSANLSRSAVANSNVGTNAVGQRQNNGPFQLASTSRSNNVANRANEVAGASSPWGNPGTTGNTNQQRSLRPAQSRVGFAPNNPTARLAQNNCNCNGVQTYQYQSQYQVPAASAPALPQLQTPQLNAPQFQLQTPQMQLPQLTGGQQQLQFLQPPASGSIGGGLGLFNTNNNGTLAGNGAAPGGGGFGFANPNGYQWNGGGATGGGLFSGIGQTGPAQRLSNWWRPLWSGRGAYVPIIKLANLSPGVYLGQGIIGQPTAYVDGQPVRNLLRYIAP